MFVGSYSIQDQFGRADGDIDVQTTILCPLYQAKWW